MSDQIFIEFCSGDRCLDLDGVCLLVDEEDEKGVHIAINLVATDFEAVTGRKPPVVYYEKNCGCPAVEKAIIVGSLTSSELLQNLVREAKIEVKDIEGQWECFATSLVENPFSGCHSALVIVGSDKRGTVYGLYTLSEQIGVSPWHWWADVVPKRQTHIFAKPVRTKQGPPSIKYRGIFINDEAPALTSWVLEKIGSCYNLDFYKKVFELLLRLKSNFLWPAMWPGYPNPGANFFIDDALNQKTADEWGVVISTSHHEPMQRSMGEWFSENSDGSWSWVQNKQKIQQYFRDGAERAQPHESYFTLGMRGEWDKPMSSSDPQQILQEVIDFQRQVIEDVYGKADSVCQLLALYKEVQEHFEKGLHVPDDITLLFADDNFGTIRRLPTEQEAQRRGGAGVYYHLEYVGAPRSYKWINSNTCGKIWHQLYQAHERGANRIWVFNVGDIKPLESTLTFAMKLAWDIETISPKGSKEFWESFARAQISDDLATDVADLLYHHDRLLAIRKHEHIEPDTFSLLNYDEFETIVDRWHRLFSKAEALTTSLLPEQQCSFFELILHPIKASYIYNKLRLCQAKNQLYGMQRRNSANVVAREILQLFDDDFDLSAQYHSLLEGKWNHIMRQPHYGYRETWHAPSRDMIGGICYVQTRQESNPIVGNLGVAVESHPGIRPGLINEESERTHPSRRDLIPGLTLPPLESCGQKTRWFELFRRGTKELDWRIETPYEWLKVTPRCGKLKKSLEDVRVEVGVDWNLVPSGFSTIIRIEVFSTVGDYEQVHIPILQRDLPSDFSGFVESDGCVSIDAAHFCRSTVNDDGAAGYEVVPSLGRSLAGSVTLARRGFINDEWLEYDMYTFTRDPTRAQLILYFNMTLDTDPQSSLQYEVMFNEQHFGPIRLIEDPENVGSLPPGWSDAVQDCIWKRQIDLNCHSFHETGRHVLRVRIWQKNVILEKFVLDLGGVRESYLGPPENEFVTAHRPH